MAVLGLCLAAGTAYYGYREAQASAGRRIAALQTEARFLAEQVENLLVEEIKTALTTANEIDSQ